MIRPRHFLTAWTGSIQILWSVESTSLYKHSVFWKSFWILCDSAELVMISSVATLRRLLSQIYPIRTFIQRCRPAGIAIQAPVIMFLASSVQVKGPKITWMTSGATYCGVPQMVSICDSCAFLARPKSAILTLVISCGVASSRFSNFRSLCTTPLQAFTRPKTYACDHCRPLNHMREHTLPSDCRLNCFAEIIEYRVGRDRRTTECLLPAVQVINSAQELGKTKARIRLAVRPSFQDCIQQFTS